MSPPNRHGRPIALEDQLTILAGFGITLRPDCTIDDLLYSFARSDYEGDPYRTLLAVLGGEVEAPPFRDRFSDNIWHFDAECIDDDNAYAAIAERLANLARGQLPIRDVRSAVDFESGDAWLELSLDGTPRRFEPAFDGDWVDPEVFTWFRTLADERGGDGRFTYVDLGGQDGLIGFATPREFKRLRLATAVNFRWM